MKKKGFFSAQNVTILAMLLALVIVLQAFGGYIRIGATPLSFVLVPIVMGGIVLGPLAGGFLGLCFGLVVVIQGLTGVDGFTMILLQDHPVYTVLLCLVKGGMAGLLSGLAYRWLANKNRLCAVFTASAVAPIVNTGLFVWGALAFLRGTLQANFVDGTSVVYFLIIGCAGINFLVELAINLVCAPALHSVYGVVEKRFKRKGK